MHSTKDATPKIYCTQDQETMQCIKDALHNSFRSNDGYARIAYQNCIYITPNTTNTFNTLFLLLLLDRPARLGVQKASRILVWYISDRGKDIEYGIQGWLIVAPFASLLFFLWIALSRSLPVGIPQKLIWSRGERGRGKRVLFLKIFICQ